MAPNVMGVYREKNEINIYTYIYIIIVLNYNKFCLNFNQSFIANFLSIV